MDYDARKYKISGKESKSEWEKRQQMFAEDSKRRMELRNQLANRSKTAGRQKKP